MLQQTKGIVLRSVKYGESSLITTVFTEHFGVQSYIAQGVRKSKKTNAGLLQPSLLLEIEVDHKPNNNLQRFRSFHPAFIYQNIQEDVIKNSIALFSSELLLKLLPEHASFQELFDFSFSYFQSLDSSSTKQVANFPLYFLIKTGELLGFYIKGKYSDATPFLDVAEGGFVSKENSTMSLTQQDCLQLGWLLEQNEDAFFHHPLSSVCRNALTDWYLDFLRIHSQHLGQLKSLDIIRSILH